MKVTRRVVRWCSSGKTAVAEALAGAVETRGVERYLPRAYELGHRLTA